MNRKRKEDGIIIGHESIFEGDECIHSGDGFIGVYIMTKQITCFRYLQFIVCQMYVTKALKTMQVGIEKKLR